MWRALASYGDAQAAVDYLLDLYRVERAELRHDVDRFLSELVSCGLVVSIPDENATGQ